MEIQWSSMPSFVNMNVVTRKRMPCLVSIALSGLSDLLQIDGKIREDMFFMSKITELYCKRRTIDFDERFATCMTRLKSICFYEHNIRDIEANTIGNAMPCVRELTARVHGKQHVCSLLSAKHLTSLELNYSDEVNRELSPTEITTQVLKEEESLDVGHIVYLFCDGVANDFCALLPRFSNLRSLDLFIVDRIQFFHLPPTL